MLRSLFCLTVFAVFAVFTLDLAIAQDADQLRRERRERRAQEVQKRQEALFQGKPPAGTATVVGRSVIYSINNGFGNTMALLEAAGNSNIRQEIGLSDEQVTALQTARDAVRMQALMQAPKYVGRFKTMTEADHKAIQADLQRDMQAIQKQVDSLISPEQQAKTRTLVFQAMGGIDSPIVNLDALQALNLTDEQKEKAGATLKEMEQQRLAQMEEGLRLVEKAVQLGGANMSPEDRAKIEAEGRVLQSRIIATGKTLGERLRGHLTEEQRQMERNLMANRPAYLPRLPRQMRGDFTEQYIPGLDSWVPGQGAPKDSTEDKQRRRPFPQKEDGD